MVLRGPLTRSLSGAGANSVTGREVKKQQDTRQCVKQQHKRVISGEAGPAGEMGNGREDVT